MPIYKTGKKKGGKEQYKIVVSFTDRNGKYRQKAKLVYGSAEAKDEEHRMQREIFDNIPDSKMTVKELFDEYIAAKKHEVRATSLQKTTGILERDVLPYLKDYSLDKLTIKALQEWKNIIAEKSTKCTTKNNALRELRALLNYAVRLEYIEKNPVKNLGNFRDPNFEATSEKLHYYTAEQFKAFIKQAELNCCSLTDYGYYVFFNIAFLTGMRKGEINALRWSDIDDNIIHVRRSIAQKLKEGDNETPPKNKSSIRDIQMPSNLVEILKQQKTRHESVKGYTDDFRVCGGIACLRDTSIENKNKKFSKEAGLPHIRIHDFRHSHASLLCNEGINIQEIARRLGHSDISMTWNTYSHLYPREEERAISILEKI